MFMHFSLVLNKAVWDLELNIKIWTLHRKHTNYNWFSVFSGQIQQTIWWTVGMCFKCICEIMQLTPDPSSQCHYSTALDNCRDGRKCSSHRFSLLRVNPSSPVPTNMLTPRGIRDAFNVLAFSGKAFVVNKSRVNNLPSPCSEWDTRAHQSHQGSFRVPLGSGSFPTETSNSPSRNSITFRSVFLYTTGDSFTFYHQVCEI